jgi:hypothetical protein
MIGTSKLSINLFDSIIPKIRPAIHQFSIILFCYNHFSQQEILKKSKVAFVVNLAVYDQEADVIKNSFLVNFCKINNILPYSLG